MDVPSDDSPNAPADPPTDPSADPPADLPAPDPAEAPAGASPTEADAGADPVRWVECPRDAWQALPRFIPTERKRAHLQALLDAGFRTLDLGSFVSPRAVPQMADTEALLRELERPSGAQFLCVIPNRRGLERALATPAVTAVGYPLSMNETFQRRNLGSSLEASWEELAALRRDAADADLTLVVYLSMGFGNPYDDPWTPADTAAAVARLRDLGVVRVALADTVGRADAATVAAVLDAVPDPAALGLHLHARPGAWAPLLDAALARGVRWLEGALAGVGGCPFAGDALVGNLPSEGVLPFLQRRGLSSGVDLARLPELARDAATLAAAHA